MLASVTRLLYLVRLLSAQKKTYCCSNKVDLVISLKTKVDSFKD